ncbi:MAG: TonB C-terminal domain-containing protein [Puniceicoccales bacterium]|nr:TonB C-terminal domain-containing protein [Puniceicoccales bacterium]
MHVSAHHSYKKAFGVVVVLHTTIMGFIFLHLPVVSPDVADGIIELADTPPSTEHPLEKTFHSPPIPESPPSISQPIESLSYEKFVAKYGEKTKTPTPCPPPKHSVIVAPKISLPGISISFGPTNPSNPNQKHSAAYTQTILSHIEKAWAAQNLTLVHPLKATVQFKIDSTGKIFACKILTSSGHSSFDQALLSLFRQLPPLPPPSNRPCSFQLTFEQGN